MSIKFSNISKSYDSVGAVDNVSFSCNNGEITGLIGSNGAGKTTSISCITKYVFPDNGEIFYNDENIHSLKNENYPISYIPDNPVFFEELTTLENLQFVLSVYKGDIAYLNELISTFSLTEHLNKLPSKLSKGNQQKLMIISALLRDFNVIIGDEPFTGLSPEQVNIFKKVLLNLKKQGKCVILSTHLLDVAETICDKYVILHKGKLLDSGSKSDFVLKYNLDPQLSMEDIYLHLLEKVGDDF